MLQIQSPSAPPICKTEPPLHLDISRVEGCVFDVDDLLIGSEQLAGIANPHVHAYLGAVEAVLGRALTSETRASLEAHLTTCSSKTLLSGMFDILQKRGDAPPEATDGETLGKLLEIPRLNTLLAFAREGKIPVLPGAVELIQTLDAAGVKLGVYTSGRKAISGPVLDLLLGPDLSVKLPNAWRVFGDEVMGKRKPDPFGWLLAAERMGIPPEKLIAFDNSPNGVEGSVKAGYAMSVGVHWDLEVDFATLQTSAPNVMSIVGSLENVVIHNSAPRRVADDALAQFEAERQQALDTLRADLEIWNQKLRDGGLDGATLYLRGSAISDLWSGMKAVSTSLNPAASQGPYRELFEIDLRLDLGPTVQELDAPTCSLITEVTGLRPVAAKTLSTWNVPQNVTHFFGYRPLGAADQGVELELAVFSGQGLDLSIVLPAVFSAEEISTMRHDRIQARNRGVGGAAVYDAVKADQFAECQWRVVAAYSLDALGDSLCELPRLGQPPELLAPTIEAWISGASGLNGLDRPEGAALSVLEPDWVSYAADVQRRLRIKQ